MEKSKEIFGNPIPKKTYKKACKAKKKFIKKYGDESCITYHLKPVRNETLGDSLNIQNLVFSDQEMKFDDKAVVIGNIRMGFGHYRISIALASCAHALGYTPYWFDLNSFPCTGGKMVEYQNGLYSMGSRLSQKSHLFNKLYWEPLNSEGFRQITYNAGDQKNAELLVPMYHDFPKDIPFVATHVWPSQGAVHAGLTNVCNAIPDNWQMGLHLSEGAIHTVQTHFAYFGYKRLYGMDKKHVLKPMPEGTLFDVGHYIDHELVSNLEADTEKRTDRVQNGKPLRFLLTVGGAGAQYDIFKKMIIHFLPFIKEKKVTLFINFGDHLNVFEKLKKDIPDFRNSVKSYENCYKDLINTINSDSFGEGVFAVYNTNIFEAVYSTNALMRISDVLVTKPSELAFYPIPKLMIQRVGGHEAYGAIHASEVGDGTYECRTTKEINDMIDSMVNIKDILLQMNKNILQNKKSGLYDGGYKVIELITKNR